jgi:hypothetical protein
LSSDVKPAGSEGVFITHIEQKDVGRWLLQRVLDTSHAAQHGGIGQRQ